jgi:predicted HAD superfamily Cof-like phosphohydrolase
MKGFMTNYEKVREFMVAMGQEVQSFTRFPDMYTAVMRYKLIHKKVDEFDQALIDGDIVELTDALCDLLYATYSYGLAFGIPLDKCFDEVHRSNLSKIGPDGKVTFRSDGKVLKPASYRPPNLEQFLDLNG